MTDDPFPHWEVEHRRSYTPAGGDRPMEYVTYRHESGDVRLRIAPASLDGDDYPGYALTATTYPDLELGDSIEVRRVLTYRRCASVAARFAALFDAAYDGPASLEAALRYARERVGPPVVTDHLYVPEADDARNASHGGDSSRRGDADPEDAGPEE